MLFKLQKLPYDYEDLEPYIDKDTMIIHHTKHHGKYVENLNKCVNKYHNSSLEKILQENFEKKFEEKNIFIINNGGGVYNHNLFWKILIPKKKFQQPSVYFINIINKNFISFDTFKKKFSDVSLNHFGSGWVWLCLNKTTCKLNIIATNNQNNPIMDIKKKNIPILGLDIWEHAYYLKYKNKRLDYIQAFWEIINWKYVEDLYNKFL